MKTVRLFFKELFDKYQIFQEKRYLKTTDLTSIQMLQSDEEVYLFI